MFIHWGLIFALCLMIIQYYVFAGPAAKLLSHDGSVQATSPGHSRALGGNIHLAFVGARGVALGVGGGRYTLHMSTFKHLFTDLSEK